jgi:predicted TIM-barrel fold metal-dependent hydrolase
VQRKRGFISVDDHVQETPDLWTSRLSKSQFGDRIPHLETVDGRDRWVVDGRELAGGRVARPGAFMSDRTQEPTRWGDVPPAAYVPAERLRAMDAAGVDYSVLYPTVAGMAGEGFSRLEDSELEQACVRAYNDWLVEEWGAASERFVPQAIIPLWPIDAMVAEIRRAVGLGHRGIVMPGVPMSFRDVPHIGDPEWDPLWSVCEELDVPLGLHAGGIASYVPYAPTPAIGDALEAVCRPVASSSVFSLFAMSRVLIRHPNLRLVFAESAVNWGMIHLEWIDHQFESDGVRHEKYVYDGVEHAGYEMTPSEMFHRQCYLNGWFDRVGPYLDFLGADRVLWSANLPHASSTYPNTQEAIEGSFEGVPSDIRDQVLWQNAASLYKL